MLVSVCDVGTLRARPILYKCGVLFICTWATPNAYHQINERLHTFFLYTPSHRSRVAREKNTIVAMSRYEQVCQEIRGNGILQELYDCVDREINSYLPKRLNCEEIIDLTTKVMIRRRDSISQDIPTEDDLRLFSKVLWKILEERIRGYEFMPYAEHSLYNTLQDRSRQLLSTMDL